MNIISLNYSLKMVKTVNSVICYSKKFILFHMMKYIMENLYNMISFFLIFAIEAAATSIRKRERDRFWFGKIYCNSEP